MSVLINNEIIFTFIFVLPSSSLAYLLWYTCYGKVRRQRSKLLLNKYTKVNMKIIRRAANIKAKIMSLFMRTDILKCIHMITKPNATWRKKYDRVAITQRRGRRNASRLIMLTTWQTVVTITKINTNEVTINNKTNMHKKRRKGAKIMLDINFRKGHH